MCGADETRRICRPEMDTIDFEPRSNTSQKVRHMLNVYRTSLCPESLEQQIFLSSNEQYWNAQTIDKIKIEQKRFNLMCYVFVFKNCFN